MYQKFAGNQSDAIIEEQASTKLTTLSQKEDKYPYVYYRQTEILLIGIFGRERVKHDGENTIIFNKVEQHILKNTIAKFGFGLKIPKLVLHMIEYRADLNRSLYRAFKKAGTYLNVLKTKTQM